MTLTATHSTPSDGTFSAAGALAWNASHTLSGVADVAQGGTGFNTLTAGRLPYGAGTSPMASSSLLWWDTATNCLVVGRNTLPTQPTPSNFGYVLDDDFGYISGIRFNRALGEVRQLGDYVQHLRFYSGDSLISAAGNLEFNSGDSYSTNFSGGNVQIQAGNAFGNTFSAIGGSFNAYAGAGYRFGGDVQFLSGAASDPVNGIGGNIYFSTGAGASGSGVIQFVDGVTFLPIAQFDGSGTHLFDAASNNVLIVTASGDLQFGTYTATAALASNGYITIKDLAGNTRKLMTTA